MTDYYRDDQRRSRSRDHYVNTDYYYSRTGPARHHDDPLRDYRPRSQSGELVRYNDRRAHSPSRSQSQHDYDRSDRQPYGHNEHRDRHNHHEHRNHHEAKDIAATLLGAVVGGTAGRKTSDGSKLATAAGVLVGAWGGHELEKSWQEHETKEKERRRSTHQQR